MGERCLWFKVAWRPKGNKASDLFLFAEPFEGDGHTNLENAHRLAKYWNGLSQNQNRFYFVVPCQ